MNVAAIEYQRVTSVGWAFAIRFEDEDTVLQTDCNIGSTGFTARQLPFEVVAQMCWILGSKPGSFFQGEVELYRREALDGFDLVDEGAAPGCFRLVGDHAIYYPAGVLHLRTLLTPERASSVVRIPREDAGIETSMTMGKFGWTAEPDNDEVLAAVSRVASLYDLDLRPMPPVGATLVPSEEAIEYFQNFDD